mmetsp:Transcript_20121/g.60736  ORF Transcript_20121/g.60736 Transcript_20121/m.60736 type:complete len:228 (+) Transcript_20121:407-1090(+)
MRGSSDNACFLGPESTQPVVSPRATMSCCCSSQFRPSSTIWYLNGVPAVAEEGWSAVTLRSGSAKSTTGRGSRVATVSPGGGGSTPAWGARRTGDPGGAAWLLLWVRFWAGRARRQRTSSDPSGMPCAAVDDVSENSALWMSPVRRFAGAGRARSDGPLGRSTAGGSPGSTSGSSKAQLSMMTSQGAVARSAAVSMHLDRSGKAARPSTPPPPSAAAVLSPPDGNSN